MKKKNYQKEINKEFQRIENTGTQKMDGFQRSIDDNREDMWKKLNLKNI